LVAGCIAQSREIAVEQAKQIVKCIVVTGMRRGRQEQEMPRLIIGKFSKQIES